MTKQIFSAQVRLRTLLAQMIQSKECNLGNYDREREIFRSNLAQKSEIVCWSSPAFFKAVELFNLDIGKEYATDASFVQNQIHFFEHPMVLDEDSMAHLQKSHPYSLSGVKALGFILNFYATNEGLVHENTKILCRNFKSWDSIQEKDIVLLASKYEGDAKSLFEGEGVQLYLMMNLFLKTPYPVTSQSTVQPRQHRSQSRRPPKTSVRIVVLRKAEKALREVDKTGSFTDHEGRTITCEFSVTGHWRNQWYASEGIHRKIFIEDFKKGEGLPKKEETVKVIKASR